MSFQAIPENVWICSDYRYWRSMRHLSITYNNFILAILCLANLIDFYQMCYCYRKLEKLVILWENVGGRVLGRPNLGGRGRPWEAALPSLAQTDHIRSENQSGEHGLPRPPKHTASHIFSCDLSEPIRESKFGLPLLASHAHWSPILGAVWLISWLNKLLCPVESDRVHERPIELRARQCNPQARLTDFMAKRIASPGRVESDRLWEAKFGLPRPPTRVRSVWEAVHLRGHARTPTASHLRLSDRSHDFVVGGRIWPLTADRTLLYRVREYNPRASLIDFTAARGATGR